MATLVVTVIGDDRPGLVDAVASVVAEHGGSWERSSMARLGSKFAGIVEVVIGDDRVDDLDRGLDDLRSGGLLEVNVDRSSTSVRRPPLGLELRLVGQDRPGIVHEIAHALAEHEVSIEELHTATSSAPMSAEPLFEAHARLQAPTELDRHQLELALEAVAHELMVEIDLSSDDH